MATLPNVLIFGGLDFLVPLLVQKLLPPSPAEPLVSHIRIVDKFIVNPPTTLIPKKFLETLRERSNLIEYRQGNLLNPAVVSKSFTDPSPNGQPYSYIIDMTGEAMPGRPKEVYIRTMLDVSVLIARTSAAQLARHPGSIKAHIRQTTPFYDHLDHGKRYKESDAEGWKPKGPRGVWWYETLRAIGSIPGLPLVVMRAGLMYGEGFGKYETAGLILLGLVYKHLNREMNLLWSPDLPKSSLNMHDFAGAVWAAAEWISTKSREEANALAGEALPPSYDPDVTLANAPNAIPASAGAVLVPAFNVVDEGDSTQGRLSEVIGRIYGIKVGFLELDDGMFEGMKLSEMAQEANEVHMEAWFDLIMIKANPPVPHTPLTPFMPLSLIEEHAYSLDGEKLRRVLGYKFRYPKFDERAVRDYIDWCRGEGIWPETDLLAPR